MTKILLSGASGFIGKYVLNHLINLNCQIICIGRRPLDISSDKIVFIEYDISKPSNEDLYKKFLKPDMFIHLAWSNLPNYLESFHITENLPNQIYLLKNLIDHGLKRLIVSGTCFEYGIQEGGMAPDMNTHPIVPYAIAKDTLHRYLRFYSQSMDIELVWLRLFYTFGYGQSKNSIISQLEKCVSEGQKIFNMSGGEQIMDYLPVSDMAYQILEAALNTNTNPIVNICSGVPIKLKDFVNDYIQKQKYEIELNLGYYPYNSYESMNMYGLK